MTFAHRIVPLSARRRADPDRYMFFSTRIRQASGSNVNTASGQEYKGVRLKGFNASGARRDIKFHFPGFYSAEATSPTEVSPGTINIDEVYIRVVASGNRYQLLFPGASATATITGGSTGAWASVVLPEDLPANGGYVLEYIYHMTTGAQMCPVYNIQVNNGERSYAAADLATIQANIAANDPDTLTGVKMYGPDMALAKGWDGTQKVAVVFNDSIGDERNDGAQNADARGNQGIYRRWLDHVGDRVAFHMMSVPGAAASRDLLSGTLKRWAVVDEAIAFNSGGKRPWTVGINQYGQNDGSTTLSTYKSNLADFLDRVVARYPGIRLIGCTLLPQTTSTDNWKTRQNQTGTSIHTPVTGNKYLINQWIRDGMDGRLAGCLDVYALVHDATYPGTWPPPLWTGTLATQAGTDGTATYTAIVVNGPPPPSLTFIGWGTPSSSNTNHTGGITSVVSNGDGTWTLNLDRTATQVAASGTAVWAMSTADQIHPEEIACEWLAANLAQSEKAKLAA